MLVFSFSLEQWSHDVNTYHLYWVELSVEVSGFCCISCGTGFTFTAPSLNIFLHICSYKYLHRIFAWSCFAYFPTSRCPPSSLTWSPWRISSRIVHRTISSRHKVLLMFTYFFSKPHFPSATHTIADLDAEHLVHVLWFHQNSIVLFYCLAHEPNRINIKLIFLSSAGDFFVREVVCCSVATTVVKVALPHWVQSQ